MTADLTFVASDDQPAIFGTLTVNGVVLNLTTADTVYFEMRPAIDRRLTIDSVAHIVTPAIGAVRYDWGPDQLLDPGNYVMRWRINWHDGSTQHSDPENTITVEAQ